MTDVIISLGKELDLQTVTWLRLGMAIPLLLLAVILVPVFMTKGFRKGFFGSAASVGCTVCAFVISLFAAKLLSAPISDISYGYFEPLFSESFSSYVEAGASLTHVTAFSKGTIAAVIAIVLFVLLFLMLLIVIKLAVRKILGKRKNAPTFERSAGYGVGGMLMGIIDALLISLLMFVPFYSVVGFAAEAVDDAAIYAEKAVRSETDADCCKRVHEVCTSIRSAFLPNIALKPVLDFSVTQFGKFKCDGSNYNCYDIISDGVSVALNMTAILEKNAVDYGEADITAAKEIAAKCRENRFFCGLAADILPSLVVTDGDSGDYTDKMTAAFAEALDTATVNDYTECVDSAAELFCLTVSHGVFAASDDTSELVHAVSDGEFISGAVECMRSSRLLSKSLDNIMLASAELIVLDDADGEVAETVAQIKNSIEENIKEGNNDISEETRSIKLITSGILKVLEGDGALAVGSFTELNVEGVSDIIIGLGVHPYIGEKNADALISAILRSYNKTAGGIFDDAFTEKILSAYHYDIANPAADGTTGKFENILFSAVRVVKVVGEAGSGGASTADMIGELISVMSPDTAEMLTLVIAEDMMESLDIKGNNLEKTSKFFGELVVNMARTEGDCDIDREKSGVSSITSLMLGISEKKKTGNVTLEEAVDGGLEAFLERVINSEVVMKTVSSSVENGGSDPTGAFEGLLDEKDAESLENACKRLLNKNPNDKELLKKLDLIRKFMGVK